jgi:hypothetical protein
MPLGTWKRPTPQKTNPTGKSKRLGIIIPQPIRFPFYIKGKDVVKWKEIGAEPAWFTLHKRSPQGKIAGDPREARAVPKDVVKGSLPERIVYKYLTDNLKLVPMVDFDFQSAQDGGRVELGGFVCDFVFLNLKFVIQVQGVHHKEYLQERKDQQQEDVMAEFGYRVEQIWEDEIYDEYRFENRMRKIFNLASGTGSAYGSNQPAKEQVNAIEVTSADWANISKQLSEMIEELV